VSALLVMTCLVLGAGFAAIAGLGLLRLPDVYLRMHASTKAGTLGAGLILLGVALHFGTLEIAVRALVVAFFLLLTAPIAAHLIGRAAYRMGTPLWTGSVIDEVRGQAAPVQATPARSPTPPVDGPNPTKRGDPSP